MKSTTKQAKPEKPAVSKKRTTTRAARAKTAATKTAATRANTAMDKADEASAAKAKAGSSAKEIPTVTVEAPAITPPQSPPKSDRRKSGGLALFLWAVGGVSAIGAGFATWPFWSTYIVGHQAVSKNVTDQISVAERLAELEKDFAKNAMEGNIIQDLLDEKKQIKGRLDSLMENINSLDAALKSVRQMVEATTPPSSQAANANKSLQKLSDRFAKIEKGSETLGNLLQRMDKLEKNIPVQQDQPAVIDKGLSQAIKEISQRVGALEEANTGKPMYGGSALILAVSQLQEVLHGSDPFSTQLAALMELAGDGSEIAGSMKKIEPYASSGISSLNLLRSRFADVSLSLTELAPATSANGWLGRVKERVSSLISMRRIDGKMDAVITRTENLLNDGDLAGAADAMNAYSDASPKVAAWVKSARERLFAESAIAALHVFALSLIAPGKEQPQ